jgi:SPP1 gp7 family putative phage head morphogenesis protein
MATRKPLLTKKRAALNRKSFKGHTLAYPAPVMERYRKGIAALVAQMTAQTRREVEKLFKSHGFTHDASPASQARILAKSLKDRFTDLFARSAKPLAENMVSQTDAASKSAIYSSLKQASGGLSLKTNITTPGMREMWKGAVAENVSLIKTIADEYLGKVERDMFRAITTGNGLADMIPALEKYEGYSHRKAELVALDQTRKVYSQTNRDRLVAVGVTKFEWIHSGGGSHPRVQHEEWDGQVFSFDDLPVDEDFGPVLPGQAINCKCSSRPVIEIEGEENAA